MVEGGLEGDPEISYFDYERSLIMKSVQSSVS